jgi:hypothetical protein
MISDLAELDVLALAVDSKDVLYAGTSPDGKVYRIDAGGMAREFFDPKAKYIWSLVFDRQGRLLWVLAIEASFIASIRTAKARRSTTPTRLTSSP